MPFNPLAGVGFSTEVLMSSFNGRRYLIIHLFVAKVLKKLFFNRIYCIKVLLRVIRNLFHGEALLSV